MTKVNKEVSSDVQLTLDKEPSHLLSRGITISFLGLMTIWGLSAIDLKFNAGGFQTAINMSRYLFDPGEYAITTYITQAIPAQSVPLLMLETLMIAFIGTVLGAVLSIPIAFLSSKNIVGERKSIYGTTIITMIRTFPVFIWALIFIVIEGGALAGVLAIGVSSIGMISKLFIEAIEDIDKGILEALDSTGATALQKIRFGIIPQLTVNFLSVTIYRFEINVKNATLLGVVGAGGIGFLLTDATLNFNFDVVAVCLWGLIPTVIIIDAISTYIRNRLATGE